MTPEERASLKVESDKGTASQNTLKGPIAKNLALEHLFEPGELGAEAPRYWDAASWLRLAKRTKRSSMCRCRERAMPCIFIQTRKQR